MSGSDSTRATSATPGSSAAPVSRPMAVAGSFYPAGAGALASTVDELLGAARSAFPLPAGLDVSAIVGVLVPHAGLVYSGVVAAAAWGALLSAVGAGGAPASAEPQETIVLLGTNHGAAWLGGVGAWDGGPWRTPLGDVAVDDALTDAVLGLGAPFGADERCHRGEHSLEVQLPYVRRLAPDARIVALSVGTGTGARAIEAGERLGHLLAARRVAGERILLAISSDMAHYPGATTCERVTATLLPSIVALAPEALATAEAGVTRREPGVSCGMCGIAPAVLGLAALRAMGAAPGVPLAAATSADAGGDPRRTVGYLAVGFEAP
jgi:AmmeMemoRadiSam system protein B